MVTTFQLIAAWFRARSGAAERGASLVEYALLIVLIAVVCAIAVQVLGTSTSTSISKTASGFA